MLLERLVARDRDGLFSAVSELVARGVDFSEVLAGLESGLHALAMAKATNTSPGDALVEMLDQCDSAWLQQAYQVLIMGGRDLQYAPEPRVGFEMTMLRLLDFVPIQIQDRAPAQVVESSESTNESSEAPSNSAPSSSATVEESLTKQETEDDSSEERRKAWQEKPVRMQAKRTEERRVAKERSEKAKEAAMQVFTSDDEPPYVQILKDRFDAELDAEWLDEDKGNPQ